MRTKLISLAAVGCLAPATAGVAVAAGAGTVLFGGDVFGSYRAKPSRIHIASNENLINISWSTWGRPTASAKGTLALSPASGGNRIPVRIELRTIKTCRIGKGKGTRLVYTRLKFRELAGADKGHLSVVDYTCA
jgi:hypothetical protein